MKRRTIIVVFAAAVFAVLHSVRLTSGTGSLALGCSAAQAQSPAIETGTHERNETTAAKLQKLRADWVDYRSQFDQARSDPLLTEQLRPHLERALKKAGAGAIEFIHAIVMIGAQGWALDWHGRLHKSSDGGLSWQETRLPLGIPGTGKLYEKYDWPASDLSAFRAMHFLNASDGWIVGGGTIFTKDGGKNWTIFGRPSIQPLTTVTCSSERTCWTAGFERGVIYVVRPGDKRWSKQGTPIQGTITALQAINNDVVYGVSQNGVIGKTENGGREWRKLWEDPQIKFRDLHFVDANHAWAVGEEGRILYSHDGGKSWIDQSKNVQDPFGIAPQDLRLHTVRFATRDKGWAAGLHGIILGTDDGGKMWRIKRFEGVQNNILSIYALHVSDPNTVWAVGNGGNIMVSIDGGDEWFPIHGYLRLVQEDLTGVLQELVK